jgi:anti-sigma regulatory factor (Ser/Thr protein kinase)
MIDEHRGRPLHYVGEPVWPGRSAQEIHEATRHEALINLVWPDADIRVLCPYDADGLEPRVLCDAERTHPWLLRAGAVCASPRYAGVSFPAGTDDALDPAPADAGGLEFGVRDLGTVRMLVREQAARVDLPAHRLEDLVMAVNELATNSIKHAGRGGRLQMWEQHGELICQLEDEGHIADPLAGRHRPVATIHGGMGLWMVNQLCDLVEIRTRPTGTVIRLHTRTGH